MASNQHVVIVGGRTADLPNSEQALGSYAAQCRARAARVIAYSRQIGELETPGLIGRLARDPVHAGRPEAVREAAGACLAPRAPHRLGAASPAGGTANPVSD
jgi:hypothetical protein